jgi:hypothetical protein
MGVVVVVVLTCPTHMSNAPTDTSDIRAEKFPRHIAIIIDASRQAPAEAHDYRLLQVEETAAAAAARR